MKRFILSITLSASALAFGAALAYANMAPPVDFKLAVTVVASAEGPRLASVQKGSSAERGGLRAGDLVLGANGRYTRAMTADEIDAYFKGTHWQYAELIVVHDGKTIELVRVAR